MDWTFAVDGPVAADLELAAGRVELDDAAGGPVRVLVEPLSGGRRAEELAAEADVGCTGGRLWVRVPGRPFDQPSLLVRAALPAGSSVTSRTASADLTVRVAVTALDATTASGDVELGDVTGDVALHTASGDLRCGTVGGRLQVTGASADVDVGGSGGDADIKLASGDVRIGASEGSVRVRTASGDVAIDRAGPGRVDLDTKSGDLRVGVAAGTGARLDVSSLTGTLRSDLPVDDHGPADAALELIGRTLSGDVHIGAAR